MSVHRNLVDRREPDCVTWNVGIVGCCRCVRRNLGVVSVCVLVAVLVLRPPMSQLPGILGIFWVCQVAVLLVGRVSKRRVFPVMSEVGCNHRRVGICCVHLSRCG